MKQLPDQKLLLLLCSPMAVFVGSMPNIQDNLLAGCASLHLDTGIGQKQQEHGTLRTVRKPHGKRSEFTRSMEKKWYCVDVPQTTKKKKTKVGVIASWRM